MGSASRAALAEVVATLTEAEGNGAGVGELINEFKRRGEMASLFVDAYRRYCWPVSSVANLKLAPFHLLARYGIQSESLS